MSVALSAAMFDELPDPTGDRALRDDQRGAIMVIGVFMAMLVVGFLYYIVGIGNTIIYRERARHHAALRDAREGRADRLLRRVPELEPLVMSWLLGTYRTGTEAGVVGSNPNITTTDTTKVETTGTAFGGK